MASGQFDGGYAYVIRASDNPVRPSSPTRPPSFGRPADPARPQSSARAATPEDEAPGDVYVYRDTDGQPDDHVAAAQGREENDAAYWYDLPGTGSAGDAPQVLQETRGPFEPLVSSTDPPGTTPRFSARLHAAEPAAPDAAHPEVAPGAADDALQDTAHAHTRKLEQIKDLYLTAAAIGEVNVDKHFDHLLAQQRELIGEYFKQSGAARPAAQAEQAEKQADAEPGDPGETGPVGGPAGAPESPRVAADQPRVW